MPDLSDITGQFAGSDWADAFAAPIRQTEVARATAGRLLHDEVGPLLSAAGLQCKVLTLDFPDASADLLSRVGEIQHILDQAIEQARAVSRCLNSPAVERFSLLAALERLVGEWRSKFGCEVTLHCPRGARVPSLATLVMSRIAESCCEYAHGCGARTIQVRVDETPLGWILEVLYHGSSPQDCSSAKANTRCGLLRLQYEAMRFRVPVVLDDAPSGGSVIRVTFPIDQAVTASR
jgi:signal transduction histidine kinase